MQFPSLRCASSACGLILFSSTIAGCNSSTGDASVPAAKTDTTTSSGESSPSATPVKPADSKDNQSPSSKNESNIPPPIEVGHRVQSTVLPDGKLFQETTYKLFSDEHKVKDGRSTEYWPNGQKHSEGNYVDGVLNGPWHYWYDNGQEAYTENRVNGKLHGQWKQLNEKGVLEEEVSYKAGKRDGRWTKYYEDGSQKKTETHYVDGVESGVRQAWWKNGQLALEETLSDGQRNGKRTTLDESGKKLSEVEYRNGRPVEKTATKGG